MFALPTATDVKVKNVITLSQKNRKPDEKPGVKLKLQMELPSEALEHFGDHLVDFVYEPPAEAKVPPQGTLDGVEPPPAKSARLTRLGSKIAKLPLTFENSGYTVEVVIGTGRPESNILIKDCILSDWVLQFKEGGTVLADCSLESPDVSKAMLGELGSMKSRSMPMRMTPPVVHQTDIEDPASGAGAKDPAEKPAPARKPGAAERAAVAKAGKDAGPAAPHKGEERPPRTERGKAQTKAALAAGEKAAAAAKTDAKASAKADAATAAFAGSDATKTIAKRAPIA